MSLPSSARLSEGEVYKILYGKSGDPHKRSIGAPVVRVDDPQERKYRHFELQTATRDETIHIGSVRLFEREILRNKMINRRLLEHKESLASLYTRRERWSKKLKTSPFTVDLFNERLHAVQTAAEKNSQIKYEEKLKEHHHRELHNEAFKRAVGQPNPLDKLRADKRIMLEQEKLLSAKIDLAKTEMRVARLFREKQRQALKTEKNILSRELLK